jgi:alpha-D-ribose 1-methylphosphonate 5-triphosphate synthase subunit PhnH
VASLPADFAAQWAEIRAGFPLGVDLVFAADARLAALPRSTAIIEGAR